MGTTFTLCRIGQDGTLQDDEDLPSVQAVFAFTEYPRFIRRLALDAGLGEVWDDYEQATDDWVQFVCKQLPEVDLRGKRQKSKKRKKGRRTRIKKWGQRDEKRRKPDEAEMPRDEEQESPDHESGSLLKQKLADTRAAVLAMVDREALVKFIMVADDGILDSKACERIGPRLRAVAENWKPASEGLSGWREFTLDIVDGMDYTARHSDVVFVISE